MKTLGKTAETQTSALNRSLLFCRAILEWWVPLGWTGDQAIHTFWGMLWSTMAASEILSVQIHMVLPRLEHRDPKPQRKPKCWASQVLLLSARDLGVRDHSLASLCYSFEAPSCPERPHGNTPSTSSTDLRNHSAPDFRYPHSSGSIFVTIQLCSSTSQKIEDSYLVLGVSPEHQVTKLNLPS